MPTDEKPPRILLVDDESSNLRALERTLRGDFDVVSFEDPAQALEALEREEFAAIVSDQRMPAMQGTELLARAARLRPRSTRIILTAFTDSLEILDAINRAELYRYITKPWDNAELVATLRQACERYALRKENDALLAQLQEANRTLEQQVAQRTEELSQANLRLSELAMTDPLTRVANRRSLLARFQEEIDRAERYARPITVALYDVDHFKAFNDMEGHLCGDEALKKIAAVLSSNLRKTDFLARYGGEEFLILMPETSLAAGHEIALRLRQAVENTVFRGKTDQAYLTISGGVAAYPKHGHGSKALVEAADQALYSAKEQGRNRIVVAH
ncbi:diguanylate cyclase [bacterium]|nr:diguanylate cyclase [bacterium]